MLIATVVLNQGLNESIGGEGIADTQAPQVGVETSPVRLHLSVYKVQFGHEIGTRPETYDEIVGFNIPIKETAKAEGHIPIEPGRWIGGGRDLPLVETVFTGGDEYARVDLEGNAQ